MPGENRRRIIFVEFCTNPDIRIGVFAPPGVEVIRLTIDDDDLTKPAGLDKAVKAVNTPNAIVILFGALPCTGGSQWQRLNWHRGNADTKENILEHRKVVRALWKNFVIAAEQCVALGGGVAFEWPRICAYWRDRSVRSFIKRHNLLEIQLNRCMYGLTSHVLKTSGMPIRKPWTIATTMKETSILGRKCDHEPSDHAPCAGADTKATEGYTDEIAIQLHHAVAEWCRAKGAR